jgi:hypothetical protein
MPQTKSKERMRIESHRRFVETEKARVKAAVDANTHVDHALEAFNKENNTSVSASGIVLYITGGVVTR